MCVPAKFLNACFCNFAACPVGTRHAVSANFSKGTSRWKRSTGTFPKYRHCKRDTGRSGLVRSALEKLSLFSPTFPVRQKHGAGNFAVCGQRLRGHVPSKRVCFASGRMQIAPSDFSRDERKNGGNPLWISEYFPEISRKRCKQDVCE